MKPRDMQNLLSFMPHISQILSVWNEQAGTPKGRKKNTITYNPSSRGSSVLSKYQEADICCALKLQIPSSYENIIFRFVWHNVCSIREIFYWSFFHSQIFWEPNSWWLHSFRLAIIIFSYCSPEFFGVLFVCLSFVFRNKSHCCVLIWIWFPALI